MKALVSAGANLTASNNESFLAARVRFGLCNKDRMERVTETVRGTYGFVSRDEAEIAVYGWSAIHWAANYGQDQVVRFLAESSCDINARDWKNITALHYAAAQNHSHVVDSLIQLGASMNAKDSSGSGPLHYACWEGNLNVCRLLLSSGADIELANNEDNTPLHWAARKGDLNMVELLLKHGANAEAEAGDAMATPLQLAEEKVCTNYVITLTRGCRFTSNTPSPVFNG